MKENYLKEFNFIFNFQDLEELFQNILIIILYSMKVDWKVIHIRLYFGKSYWTKSKV